VHLAKLINQVYGDRKNQSPEIDNTNLAKLQKGIYGSYKRAFTRDQKVTSLFYEAL